MKAIIANGYGDPETLELADLPDPKVGPDSVLVRVRAAGVNPVDWKVLAGYLDPIMNVHFPLVLGWDVSGVVEAVGADATEFAVGDEVIGYVRKDHVQHGTFAELVAAPVRALARKPAALSWTEAAGLPLVGLTALATLRRIGLKEGEKVLIHGGAGGVGSVGVQIARAFGARVIATASERNHEFLRSLGAEPVTYGDGLVGRVREIAPNGVDAVADFVGGDAVDQSLPVVGDPTRIASIASDAAKAHGGHVVWARPDSAMLAELAALADDGKLTVHVDTTLPLARTAEALRLNMAGHVRGKVVIEVA